MVGKDEAFTKTRLPPKPRLLALSTRGVPSAVCPQGRGTGRTSAGGNLGSAREHSTDAVPASGSTDAAGRGEVRAGTWQAQRRRAGARNCRGPARAAGRSSEEAAITAARSEHAPAFPRTQARMRPSSMPKTSGKLIRPRSVHFRPVRGNRG
ncbi:hypothetical protein I79_003069 [Cricetulus griseus]|uniref:Uncharacterized protein n=1 Tax=Cricetulus griseus TaxID=10029 RepID=G3GZ19_CRIGR|nr:hypothetical protein I79_003069 [Cricetulus griseus]